MNDSRYFPAANDSHGDFFAPIFAIDNLTKVSCIVLGMVLMPVNLALLHAIVWYERFGSDLKRNLTNQLAATLMKSGIGYELLVAPLSLIRPFVGPLPRPVCFVKMVVVNSILMQALLLHDAVVISKFLFLTVIKNPFGLHDDFWSFMVTIWVVSFSFVNEFVYGFLPGRMPMEYQICAGTNPLEVAEQKINLPLCVTYLITLVVNATVPLKIYTARLKETPKNVSIRQGVQSLGMYSFTTSVVLVITMSFSMLALLYPYKINQERAVWPKFHTLTFLLSIVLPQLTAISTIVGYLLKHKSLRKGLLRNALEVWNDR